MAAGAYYIPKQSTSKPLGDDAHFVSEAARTIGVFDGVGGWAKRGIDAGVYARELMHFATLSARYQHDEFRRVEPTLVLEHAYALSFSNGSSTACVLTLDPNGVIRAANVRDSGFTVIRGGRIIYRSAVQQTRFNRPVQLGRTRDKPAMAEQILLPVEPGDVIVMGTDGVFDNVSLDELENLAIQQGVSFGLDRGKDPTELAQKIACFALNNALSNTILSPYSLEKRHLGIDPYAIGGKYDDITVVVAFVNKSY